MSRPLNLSPSAASSWITPSAPDGCGTGAEAAEKVHVASVRNHAPTRLLGGWQLREWGGGGRRWREIVPRTNIQSAFEQVKKQEKKVSFIKLQ